MNKMKKLLSILLAVVLALSSMSIIASAAPAKYKTVADLEAMSAYSVYGGVTKLNTETRMSILFDQLDIILGQANIALAPIDIIGIATLNVNLTSVDNLCATVTSAKTALDDIGGAILGLGSVALKLCGIIGELNLDCWDNPTRSGAQLTIVSELLEVLSTNKDVLVNVVKTGKLDLGIVANFLPLDLSGIEGILGDLPGLIKGLVWGLFERWDDTLKEIKAYDTSAKGNGGVESTLNTFVKSLFTNDMSITTVKYDKDGKMTSEHTNMPINTTAPGTPTDDSPRCYYLQNGNTLKIYHIVDEAEAKASGKTAYTYVEQEETYYLEQEVEGSETYVWKSTDEFGNVTTLKWYNDNSPFLPGFSGDSIDISTMSAAQLLYTFIPPVFENMAPVVLNGSVKKILAEFFGAQFTYVGEVGDAAVNALPDASNAFFTEEQGEYLWEWSNYAVINGNHYWRFEDQIWAADISKTNNYFDIIDWGYEITGDFMDEFLPTYNGGTASKDNTLLMNLNNFLIKVAEKIALPSAATEDEVSGFEKEWKRPAFTKGGNENLVANIKAAAQAVISLAPQHIFGSDYATNPRCYFDLLMSNNNQTILTGLAATLVDALMPQMILPDADDIPAGTSVGAILAAVVRELATQLTPETNYDALIYSDYNTKTFVATQADGAAVNNEYWLDVILTMGVDIGVHYLHNIVDFGYDTDGLVNLGWGYGKTYVETDRVQANLEAYWETIAGYVSGLLFDDIDGSYTWNASVMFSISDNHNVWVALGDLLKNLLPITHILNVDTKDSLWLETLLRDNLILALVNLEWTKILDLVKVPDGYLRNANVLDQLALAVKGIVNSLFAKVGGGTYALLPSGMTDLDSLANQDNIASLVDGLLGALPNAFNNGLLRFALPIVNLLLGWKVTAQAYAEPIINLSYEDGVNYLYTGKDGNTTASGTIHLMNNAAGMLLKHRTSTLVDKAYVLKVTSVTSDDASVTVKSGLNTEIHPGESGDLTFDVAYTNDKAVMLEITYEFTGKSGAAIGGPQVIYAQTYISNKYTDSEVTINGSTKEAKSDFLASNEVKVSIATYKPYWFINNLAQVESFGYTFKNEADNQNVFVATGTYSGTASAPFALFETSKWVHGSSENSALLPHGAMKHTKSEDTNKQNSYTLNPYIYDETSAVEIPSGTKLNLPVVSYIGWRNKKKSVAWDKELQAEFYYYDLTPLEEVYNDIATVARDDFAGASDSLWNTFKAARDAAATLIYAPMMRDTFTATYSVANIQAKADALEAAYEALVDANKEAGSSSVESASTEGIEANLAKDDDKYGLEINYQDYVLYEYFKYQDTRTLARNILAQYEKPKLIDEYYIVGSGISLEELNKVIAAENNAAIAAGIEASKTQRKPEEMEASQAAIDAYVAPTYTKLYLDDIADKLDWYRQFIEQDEVVKQFLAKEIAYADANYKVTDAAVEALYTADSWKAYKDAYDYAVEVNSGTTGVNTLQSTVFEAKWGLMVAMKNLLLKENSLIEQGGTSALKANIDTAEDIFASLEAGDGAWALKEGVDADKAYAELISALGYYYVGEDGNTWNLYADSALEYADNDRPNRQANQAKVNAANKALADAIANFEAAAAEPNTLVLKDGAPFEAIIDTVNCGEYTGAIYGFDTLGWNDDFVVDGTIADFVTTAYGDDYLDVIPADGGETTGTLINVLDEEGNAVETYVYIYFGDIDMDGAVGVSDAYMAEMYEVDYAGIETLYQFMSGDLDGDSYPGASDAYAMEMYEVDYAGIPYQVDAGAVAKEIAYEIF